MTHTKSNNNTLMSVAEVSDVLGISKALCRGLIKAGTIKSVLIGKRHKVKPSDLNAYIDSNTYTPARTFSSARRYERRAV